MKPGRQRFKDTHDKIARSDRQGNKEERKITSMERGEVQRYRETRWVALMIQLEQQQHGEFVGGGVVGG